MSIKNRHSWSVMQAAVLALMIRYIQKRFIKTANTNKSIAFLWIFLEPMMHVGLWLGVRLYYNIKLDSSMPIALFVLLGTIPYLAFLRIISRSVLVIRQNRQLLTFKQIQPIDFVLALVLSESLILFMVLFILLFSLSIFGIEWQIYTPLQFFRASVYLLVFLTGFAIYLSVIGFFFPFLNNIMSIFTRFLYLTSGVFFPVSSIPPHMKAFFSWNPLFHLIEMFRESFIFVPPHDKFISESYLLVVSVFILALGMFIYLALKKQIMIQIEKQ